MDAETIRKLIESGLPGARADVQGDDGVHFEATVVADAFRGKLPLALRPKMKIGALNFEMLSGVAARPYNKRENAKYKSQQGAVASRINQD